MTVEEQRTRAEPPLWEISSWRERFGMTAGITGRGSAAAPFDLGLWSVSPVVETMTRWRVLRAGFPEFSSQVMAHQVHGDRVLWHDNPTGWILHEGADGHATGTAGVLLMVTVADCVPIYLIAPEQGAIALLHAGWRGTAAGILARGIELITTKTGAKPADLLMHTGVAISGPRYQVGREVIEAIKGPKPLEAGPWHLDLRDALAAQARVLGVGEISQSPHCSAAPGGDFFSHRASGGRDGRMVAWLGRLPVNS